MLITFTVSTHITLPRFDYAFCLPASGTMQYYVISHLNEAVLYGSPSRPYDHSSRSMASLFRVWHMDTTVQYEIS